MLFTFIIFSVISFSLAGGPSYSGFELDPDADDTCNRCQDVYTTISYNSFCLCAKPPGSVLYGIKAVAVGNDTELYGCCVGEFTLDPNQKYWVKFELVDPELVKPPGF